MEKMNAFFSYADSDGRAVVMTESNVTILIHGVKNHEHLKKGDPITLYRRDYERRITDWKIAKKRMAQNAPKK